MQYDKLEGTDSAIVAARHVIASMAQMALDCGVLPHCEEVLRALCRPALCLVAIDREANVVACAASCAFAHPEHAGCGKQAWWGMLATHPSRRGHRLSLILGAHVLLEMETRFGFRAVMTGVEPGNAPSESIYARIGLSRGTFVIIACTDSQALVSRWMTE